MQGDSKINLDELAEMQNLDKLVSQNITPKRKGSSSLANYSIQYNNTSSFKGQTNQNMNLKNIVPTVLIT